SKENLPQAEKMSQEVICLPIYPDLVDKDVEKITSLIT
ncbi:MAG: DegT/DnrJ/EryC1/StrS family aminotransferase, partial [Candidatus Marinimicrobia bacterium]|nr:DegT/DnrJ/EryC1/StrS family aminotransferase [Candidatus Neomarinimicrobiota bacterium]